jgi:hypothetical protein
MITNMATMQPSATEATWVPHLQENAPPWDPIAGLYLGFYGVLGGWVCSHGRGTPVGRCF